MRKKKTALGRSWLRGETTLHEVLRLTKAFDSARHLFDEEAMEGSIYDVIVVDGPLHVKGNFSTFQKKLCGLVVRGDFVVDGHYADTDDPNTGVYVLGNMRARSVFTNGTLNVKGDLDAGEGLIGFYNDFLADIRGRTSARFLLTEEHWFEFGGKVNVDFVLGPPRGKWPKTTKLVALPPSRYPEVLMPGTFTMQGHPFDPKTLSAEEERDLDDLLRLEIPQIRSRLIKGRPVLRPAHARARAK